MAQNTVGNAWIEFSEKGFKELQTKMIDLENRFDKVGKKAKETFGDTLNKVAAEASNAFQRLNSSVLGFVSVASPQTFARLQGQIGALSVEIGRILVPIVQQLTSYVRELTNWFHSLSDAQRQEILDIVKFTGSVLLAIVALNKFNQAMQFVSANPWFLVAAAIALVVMRAKELNHELAQFNDDLLHTKEGHVTEKSITEAGMKKSDLDKASKEDLQKDLDRQRQIIKEESKRYSDQWDVASMRKGAAQVFGPGEAERKFTEAAKKAAVLEGYLKNGGKVEAGGKDQSKFGLELRPQAPQLMAVAEAWRKAQTAQQGETPELMILQQQLKALNKIEEKLPDQPLQKKDLGAAH